MVKKQKIFSKEFPVPYETLGDFILLSIVNKFGVEAFREIYLKIATTPEYDGRDKDVEFSQNYHAMNIKGKALLGQVDFEKFIEEIKAKINKKDLEEFDKTFNYVWAVFGPSVIFRSNKLLKSIKRQQDYEIRKKAKTEG